MEVSKYPPVVGLDDPVHLNHEPVSRQLLGRHEGEPDLMVKGLWDEGEAHPVVGLDGLGDLVDDVWNTRERGELGLEIQVVGGTGGDNC